MLYGSSKSCCSPLKGDLEIGEETGEEMAAGQLSTVDSSAFLFILSVILFRSSTCFIAGVETFAFPLTALWIQPESRWMREKIMTERTERQCIFQKEYTVCFSSPGRGDFTPGEEDSEVGSTTVSSLKVIVCCFGGVPTNPPLSVDTNQQKNRHHHKTSRQISPT